MQHALQTVAANLVKSQTGECRGEIVLTFKDGSTYTYQLPEGSDHERQVQEEAVAAAEAHCGQGAITVESRTKVFRSIALA